MKLATLHAAKRAARDRFAWPGGYELFIVTADGGALCNDCARKEWPAICCNTMKGLTHSGWCAEGIDHTGNCDEAPVYCDHCGRPIYEPEAARSGRQG